MPRSDAHTAAKNLGSAAAAAAAHTFSRAPCTHHNNVQACVQQTCAHHKGTQSSHCLCPQGVSRKQLDRLHHQHKPHAAPAGRCRVHNKQENTQPNSTQRNGSPTLEADTISASATLILKPDKCDVIPQPVALCQPSSCRRQSQAPLTARQQSVGTLQTRYEKRSVNQQGSSGVGWCAGANCAHVAVPSQLCFSLPRKHKQTHQRAGRLQS